MKSPRTKVCGRRRNRQANETANDFAHESERANEMGHGWSERNERTPLEGRSFVRLSAFERECRYVAKLSPM